MNRMIGTALSASLLCAATLSLAHASKTPQTPKTKAAGAVKAASDDTGTAKLTDTIASVNGKPVTWQMLFTKIKADAKATPNPAGAAFDPLAQSVGQAVGDVVSKGVFSANGTPVTLTQSDVLKALKKNPPVTLTNPLQTMLRDMALEQEAAKQGLKVDNAFVDAYITDILKKARQRSPDQFPNNMTDDQFLAARQINRAQLRNQIRWQAIVTTLAQKQTEKEVGHPYSKADFVKARHILIAVKQVAPDAKAEEKLKAEQEALDKIKAIAADIKSGKKKFEDAAKESSEDPSAKQNAGELGVFGHGQMVPEFEKAAFSMKKGELSEPIKTQFGYHIIEVEATGADLEDKDVQAQIDNLNQQKAQQYLQELMSSKAKIVNNLQPQQMPMGGMMPGGGGVRPMVRPNSPRPNAAVNQGNPKIK